MEKVIKITSEKAFEIIDAREPREPKGLFYTEEDGVFVGIDNTTGDAWTKEFSNLTDCLEWLRGEYEL